MKVADEAHNAAAAKAKEVETRVQAEAKAETKEATLLTIKARNRVQMEKELLEMKYSDTVLKFFLFISMFQLGWSRQIL